MPFPENTPGIDELINLPVGEIALLPVDLLAAMQREIDAAAKQMKAVTARFNTALEVRFATRAAEVRSASGRDTGTVRFDEGDFTIVADLPKRVDWDQDRLAAMVERIRAFNPALSACVPRKASASSTPPNHAPATIAGSARCPVRHGSRPAIAKD
jgi:uncharacterized coiled-coil protein SlyX